MSQWPFRALFTTLNFDGLKVKLQFHVAERIGLLTQDQKVWGLIPTADRTKNYVSVAQAA